MYSIGIPPVTGPGLQVLILGSFPGALSLQKREYYANPRNRFWQVMEGLLGIDVRLPYHDRTNRLVRHNIALWDVLFSCHRRGSADHRISRPVPNDLSAFVASCPSLCRICLNGKTAARYYRQLSGKNPLPAYVLPSTSPANTRFTFEEIVQRWSLALSV